MISKEDVEHIAALARLELSEIETRKMQKDLSAILDYFNLLNKALPAGRQGPKPAKMEKMVAENILRKDEVINENVAPKILSVAPDKKDGYLKVKQVF